MRTAGTAKVIRACAGALLLVGALVRCSSFDSGDPGVTPPAPTTDATPPDGSLSLDALAPPSEGGPPQRCDPSKPFGDAVKLIELPTGCAAGRLTEDRLRIYFFAPEPTFGLRIYTATRTSVTASFDAATLVNLGTPTGEIDSHPTITRDSNTLFFQRSVDGGSGDRNILYAQSVGPGTFGTPTPVTGLSSPASIERTPFTASDGAIWVTLDMQLDGGPTRRIARAEKIGQGLYSPPVPVDLRTPGGSEDGDPLLSVDLLHIYFASTRGTGDFNMFTASRLNPAAAFSDPVSMTTLNTVDAEQPTSISSDDCELLFNRQTGTVYHIWRATRTR